MRTSTPSLESSARKRKAPRASASELACIEGCNWLTDTIVDRAQNILAQQFSEIGSFQPVCVFVADKEQAEQLKPVSEGPWVQILQVNGNHWVTASNVQKTHTNTVQLYDTMFTHAGRKLTEQLAVLAVKPVGKVGTLGVFTIQHINVQRQEGGNDCGLFAIAIATSLCFGHDPVGIKYTQSAMRQHLLSCLVADHLTPFPSRIRRLGERFIKVQSVQI